jgi:hypothetical protein
MATVLTDVGQQWIADRMSGVSAADGQYVAWGTGAGTADAGDTTLFTEASEARVSGTVTTSGTGASAKYQNVATITANGTKTITNAGNFTAAAAGTLIIKGDFTGIAVNSGDTITFTITYDPA